MQYLYPIVFCFILAGCMSNKPLIPGSSSHRYFLEVDRPGSVYSLLENHSQPGALIRLVEINEGGRPMSDTLTAWVQHYNGRNRFSDEARLADMVIACHREDQPAYAQSIHVLPKSTDNIFVYMMQGGVLIVSDEKISYYDVLIAARNAR